ncbi:hypothetical protein GCM10010832_11180 [Psychroflexus planctonicus]|uniref:Beta-galactosidase n=1 Tax=Psychroflexus planctonicus TaxID=1526575 RepID=A0ABQ1SHH4_9FLAO|nr:hypothetical protein GCM10010832_11180 [Psychroflexus planctonicus]
MFLNGKSLGVKTKRKNASPQERYRLMWMDVKYEPGTLKVVALNNEGEAVAEKEVKTAGQPHQLVLKPEQTKIKANGEDLAFVEVSVVDKNGIPCPTATHQLNFEVTGNGSFRAACNGDPTSLELFHLPTMKLFSGKLVVLVQASKEAGEINLKVSGEGLKSESITLESVHN